MCGISGYITKEDIIKYDYSVNGNTYIYICFMGSPYPFIDIYKNNNLRNRNKRWCKSPKYT